MIRRWVQYARPNVAPSKTARTKSSLGGYFQNDSRLFSFDVPMGAESIHRLI